MGTITGTYIEEAATGNKRVDNLINVLVQPTIAEYRQLIINYETGTIASPTSCRFTYQNWNPSYPVEVFLNGSPIPLDPSRYSVDYTMGRITLGFELTPGDSVMATYCFDYFPVHVLQGYIQRAVVTMNTAGNSMPTNYTYDTIPEGWLGIVADLVVAMCMERLILDYDIWKGRLIFAIDTNALYNGGDNIVSQLETVKHNAEDRAYRSLDNAKLRVGGYVAKPTKYYYESLLTGSAMRYKNGNPSYGALRGAKFNKFGGNWPRQ